MKKFLILFAFLANSTIATMQSMQKPVIPNPLTQAIKDNNSRIVSLLLAHGPACDDDLIIHKAIWHGGPTVLKLVLSHTTKNINFLAPSISKTPLCLAIMKNNNCVDILFQHGADLNYIHPDGATPMHLAAQEGHANLIEFFFHRKMAVNCTMNNGATPLHLAAQNNYKKSVDFLLEHGAIVDSKLDDGRTPLFLTSQQGNTQIVKTLICYGANINTRTNVNSTPLLLTAQNGHQKTVKVLLKNNADINAIEDSNGLTPLHVAAYQGHKKIIKLLLMYKSNINAQNNEGSTPLLMASQEGHYKIVRLLLRNNADTAITMCDGPGHNKGSALYVACQNGHFLVVRELINHGANIFYQVSDRYNPLNWAYKNNHMHIVAYLEKIILRKKQQETHIQQCIICLEELLGEEIIKLPCCKPNSKINILHRDCYALTQATSKKCPLCRADLPAL